MKVLKKLFIFVLLGALLIGIVGSECFGAGRYYCPVHMVYYSELGTHGGTQCQRRVVTTSSRPVTTTITTTTISRSLSESSTSDNDNFILFNVPVQIIVSRGSYLPSRRRLIYYNNVYSGRQIHYLGSDWGWKSESKKSKDNQRQYSTGYRGVCR